MNRSTIAATLLAGAALLASSCKTSQNYTHLYRTEPMAPSLDEASISSMKHLGPTIVDNGVNFGVWSSRATRIDLLLFDGPDDARPAKEFPMTKVGNVWNLYVEGVGDGQIYGYVAWGPNWPFDPSWYPGSIAGFLADVNGAGDRFNPNKLLIDPYGKAITRDHDWSRASAATGPKRTESTWGAASKSVVVESHYAWSDHETQWRQDRSRADMPGHNWNDLVVYEVHPKGFTADPSSGVTHPGTFRGIGEKASYLSDLGVNAVELLPVHEKPLDGGYWGYWTESFFAPEITYSSTRDPLLVADEFKEMVDRLHQQGVEVILDVVFNHTGEGGLWRDRVYTDDVVLDPSASGSFNIEPKEVASIYSYRGLDNAAYYALTPDNQYYWNNTGVGNESRDNFSPMRALILDSLRWYVDEMHVDGFRFDEAGILGEKDLDYNSWDDPANTVLQDIVEDPELQKYNTRLIVEPWSAGGNYGSLIGAYPSSSTKPGTGFAEWNGRYRDWWRSFVNYDDWTLSTKIELTDAGFALTGSHDYYAWNGREPYHSLNFVTCHDGFTMYDLVSYDHKRNGCGPLNPVCCTSPTSPWCEVHDGVDDNRSRDWGADEITKRALMRDFFTAMMVSEGTPMILGGDEWMRTQYGNNNAYSTGADNAWNWFRWGDWQADPAHERMHDFVRAVIKLRRTHEYAFAPAEWGGAHFTWRSPRGDAMTDADWGGRETAMDFDDPAAGPRLIVLFNLDRGSASFELPPGITWQRLLDTQSYFDTDDYFTQTGADPLVSANASLDAPVTIDGTSYLAGPSSIVVLEAAP